MRAATSKPRFGAAVGAATTGPCRAPKYAVCGFEFWTASAAVVVLPYMFHTIDLDPPCPLVIIQLTPGRLPSDAGYVLEEPGASGCSAGRVGVSPSNCIRAATSAGASVGRYDANTSLIEGSWGWTPRGCFVHAPPPATGNVHISPHYSHGNGQNNGDYQPVCQEGKHAKRAPLRAQVSHALKMPCVLIRDKSVLDWGLGTICPQYSGKPPRYDGGGPQYTVPARPGGDSPAPRSYILSQGFTLLGQPSLKAFCLRRRLHLILRSV